MNSTLWALGILIALLAATNAAMFWECAIKNFGKTEVTIGFLYKLVFDQWFILVMASAFTATLLNYMVLKDTVVLAGMFFLSLQMVFKILVC